MQDQTAEVIWNAGDVPVSVRFDDPYFSLENGLAETRHVFLGGNDLPDAWLAAAVEQLGEHLVSFDRDFKKLLGRARFTLLQA